MTQYPGPEFSDSYDEYKDLWVSFQYALVSVSKKQREPPTPNWTHTVNLIKQLCENKYLNKIIGGDNHNDMLKRRLFDMIPD